jgi:hypothetical protein
VLAPLDGKPAHRAAARFEEVQELLGDHQDSVGARAVLRFLGATAPGRAENGFTFGLLHRAEEQRAATARAAWPKVLDRALAHKHVGWLAD